MHGLHLKRGKIVFFFSSEISCLVKVQKMSFILIPLPTILEACMFKVIPFNFNVVDNSNKYKRIVNYSDGRMVQLQVIYAVYR